MNWDSYAALEPSRILDVLRLYPTNPQLAVFRAENYQREEAWIAARALNRLRLFATRYWGARHVTSILYFADAFRQNAGEHYRSLVECGPFLDDADDVDAAFREFLWASHASNIRIYGVEAQGLLTLDGLPQTRIHDAEDSLSALSRSTGGNAFLRGGVNEKAITSVIGADNRCVLMLSFSPGDLPRDRPLAVDLRSTLPGVKVETRSEVVIPSHSAMQTARIMAAFVAPGVEEARGLRVALVPIGFDRNAFSALAQLRVQQSHGDPWDIGGSVVSANSVLRDFAGQIKGPPDLPVVLEAIVQVKPGPHELIAVARNVTTDEIVSARIEGSWGDLPNDGVVAFPTVVYQPAAVAGLRGGESRTESSLVIATGESLRPGVPTVFATLVCGRTSNAGVTVERAMEGLPSVEPFRSAPLTRDDPCVQVRDVTPLLVRGQYRYRLKVETAEGVLASTSRSVVVE